MSREFRARSRKYRASGYSASGCGVDECAATWNDSTESGSAFHPSVGTYPYAFKEEEDESFEEKNTAKQMKPKSSKGDRGLNTKIRQKTLTCGPMRSRAGDAEYFARCVQPAKLVAPQSTAPRKSLWFEARVWLYTKLFKLQRR